MMNDNRRSVVILFGSQTGNAESIAQDINDQLSLRSIDSCCKSLNEAATASLRSDVRAVVIVCSTTGNGDSPDNADKFWRTIKKRTLAKDTFEGLSYCVLALGDTNYDKFCHMGKSIDKRMKDLGGSRFLDLHCADEATGLEEVVEKFRDKAVHGVVQLLADDVACPAATLSASVEFPNTSSHELETRFTHSNASQVLLNGTATIMEVCNFLGILPGTLSKLPEPALLLRSRKSGEGCVEILDACHEIISNDFALRDDGEYSVDHPYIAEVLEANYLTLPSANDAGKWGEEREVIRVELGISGSGIQYQPGDYISIVAPNPVPFVNLIIKRLQMNSSCGSSGYESISELSPDSKVRKDGEILTLQELLQFRLDLVGVPRKACVFALSNYCSDESEAIAMKWLCSKGDIGKKLWANFVELQSIGIVELLAMFPSCCPPLHVLVTFVSPLSPRPYSVASSPLAHPSSVVIVFSVVRYICGLSLNDEHHEDNESFYSRFSIKRSGLCTSYLADALQPFLRTNDLAKPVSLRIMWKASISFRLPGNVAAPLIMIGPGTGVAPFIGFLESRAVIDKERCQSGEDTTTGLWRGGFELDEACCKLPHEGSVIDNFIQHVEPGPTFLFYGCRNDEDWILKDCMLNFLADGVLTGLEVAFSRQTEEKVYVTHKLLDRGDEVATLLLTCNAHVYICGDGNHMAKDVLGALTSILSEFGGLTEGSAEEFLDDMRSRRRLLMDVWSS